MCVCFGVYSYICNEVKVKFVLYVNIYIHTPSDLFIYLFIYVDVTKFQFCHFGFVNNEVHFCV